MVEPKCKAPLIFEAELAREPAVLPCNAVVQLGKSIRDGVCSGPVVTSQFLEMVPAQPLDLRERHHRIRGRERKVPIHNRRPDLALGGELEPIEYGQEATA